MPVTSNGPAIQAIREKAGVSKADMARALGMSKTHMGHVESGKRRASEALRKAIAAYLRVPMPAIETYTPDEVAS
jgi:transcriptional regulator with XRE-family HTH domain